ncbi:MAG: cellulose synthase family protein [Rhodothermia bacterium]
MIATLYAIAAVVLVIYGLNLLWLAFGFFRHDRLETGDSAVDIARNSGAQGLLEGQLPVVTIQLPIYNERFVAKRLIDACAAIRYPSDKLEIQVLDDSIDDTVEIIDERVRYWLARGRNIVHVRRRERSGFKAGALQHGLSTSRGEFIAIFDADFVPPPDFLTSTVPHFSDSNVGMVQTRWVFLNRDWSLLTRLQALSLEAHFAVEQFVRNRAGCFINFNGTGGIWRRACIDEAGGWHADTLTEDLDLSYRAQLKGWRFTFLRGTEAPSELPIGMNAFRAQQFRWTKGAIQTARKTIGNLVRQRLGAKTTVEGVIHLTSHLVFPFLLLAGLLHAPLFYLKATASGPGDWYFAVMTIGVVALFGVFLVQLFAQRWLHADWVKRMTLFPLFLAGSMGFSINNTFAVADALSGRQSPFVRTPKLSNSRDGQRRKWWDNPYATRRLPRVVFFEIAMTVYSASGLVLIIVLHEWMAVPFQAFLTLSFGLVSIFNLAQVAETK